MTYHSCGCFAAGRGLLYFYYSILYYIEYILS